MLVIQFLLVHILAFVILSITNLFSSTTTEHFVRESIVLMRNCALFLDEMARSMKIPKKVGSLSRRSMELRLSGVSDSPTIARARGIVSPPALTGVQESLETSVESSDVDYAVRFLLL